MADMDPRTGRLASLSIRCACGYSVHWPAATIKAKAGAWMRPYELRQALRCTSCGAKGPPKVSISGERR